MPITYDGVTLPSAFHTRGTTEHAIKENAFPGLNGIEEMKLGTRGREFSVNGRIENVNDPTFNPEKIEEWKEDREENTLIIGSTSFQNVIVTAGSCNEFKTVSSGNQTCRYSITFKKLR